MLADDFFFLALDDRTGRFRLSHGVTSLGLAGALLGELLLERRIGLADDRIYVADRRPPPDALAHGTLDQLVQGGAEHHPIRSWLAFLAKGSVDAVAGRLWRARKIERVTTRRLWRTETTYPPTDINDAALPTARLATALERGQPITWAEALLAALTVATGLDSYILFTAPDSYSYTYLQYIVDRLSPSERLLVAHLQAAVGDAVLTGRT